MRALVQGHSRLIHNQPVPDVDAPPDLFAAMQQQLGLQMKTTKTAVDVMVIDKVQKPSEN